MRGRHATLRRAAATCIVTLLAACDASRDLSGTDTLPDVSPPRTGGFVFTPLAASQVCTIDGGDPTNPFLLPVGFGQTIVAAQPDFAEAIDMNTQNETGPD